ncbi:vomeronasal type-2 receptor 26-like [Aquarana catesbeiana]|uniref:vomeronasal type-2 receptor 26-like n=1 Tax=Aquarana catesbeiana TaxID=8400 RepID=UPI003CC924D2
MAPSPACYLQIVPAYEDYEYVQDGDIIIGGVFTVNCLMAGYKIPGKPNVPGMFCLKYNEVIAPVQRPPQPRGQGCGKEILNLINIRTRRFARVFPLACPIHGFPQVQGSAETRDKEKKSKRCRSCSASQVAQQEEPLMDAAEIVGSDPGPDNSIGNKGKDIFFEKLYCISLHNCTGQEHLPDFGDYSSNRTSDPVYHAVESMVNALQVLHSSQNYSCLKGQADNKEKYRHKVPKSQCSESCSPGYRKVPGFSIQYCCHSCVPCSYGEISNITDSENCMKCPDHEWPNENKTRCIAKEVEFLSFTDDKISLVFITFSPLCFGKTLLVLAIFILHQDTPVVKANNKSLSFVLLVSIMLGFLCVFLFLGRPVDVTCLLRQISFGILFTIAVSSVLAKTIMVCIAFKATKPNSVWRKWIGVKLPTCIVLACSSVQVIICVSWLSISPPYQELDTYSYQEKIIIQCNEGSVIGFYSVLGYMGILAAVSCIIAFFARTLPDSFNEAKYITFSMLVFCSVWIAMIPAYLSTKGKYTVAVEIFAILISNNGLLYCIFITKCFRILCRPELNTKGYLHSKGYM